MPHSEAVQFFSGPGFRLAAVFRSPDAAHGPHPAVLLCNGFMGLKEIYMPQAGAALAAAGIASLAFDYRGFGESEGPRYRLLPTEQLEDIHNGISYLLSRPDVDPTRVAIWGTSLGGAHAVTATGTDERVKCVVANIPGTDFAAHVLRRPAADLPAFLEGLAADRRERVTTGVSRRVSPLEILPYDEDSRRAYETSLARYPERREMLFPLETADRLSEYRPERFVDLISPRPLLLISAELDQLTPPDEQRKLFERAGEPKRLEVLRGATHYSAYTSPFFDEALALSVEFYKENLL